MKTTKGQTLTNYISKKDGSLCHGSELSHFDRFKSGKWEKVCSFQCNQNMPYENGTILIAGKEYWNIVRNVYGKQVHVAHIKKI